MNRLHKKDLLAGVLFLVLGIFTVFIAIPIGVQVPSTVKVRALSPDFWPMVIGGGVILSALFLILEACVVPRQTDADEDAADAAQFQLEIVPATLRAIILVAGLFAFYFSLNTLGIVAASIILLIAMMLFFDERRYLLVALLGIGIPVLLYVFFRYVASVPMPLGVFEFLA